MSSSSSSPSPSPPPPPPSSSSYQSLWSSSFCTMSRPDADRPPGCYYPKGTQDAQSPVPFFHASLIRTAFAFDIIRYISRMKIIQVTRDDLSFQNERQMLESQEKTQEKSQEESQEKSTSAPTSSQSSRSSGSRKPKAWSKRATTPGSVQPSSS